MNTRLILILALLAAPPTYACTSEEAKAAAPRHVILSMRDAGKKLSFPSRTVLSLPFAVAPTAQWPLTIAQEAPESVRLLTAKELAHIVRARALVDKSIDPEARFAPGVHLGLLYPGRAAVFLTNPAIAAPNTYRFDIEVSDDRPEEAPQRVDAVLKLQSKDQVAEHNVRYGDLIEVTLPGSSLDEWNTDSADAAGFTLHRKRSGGAGMVTLVFSAAAGGGGELVLGSKAAGAPLYRFRFKRRVTVAC